MVSLEACTADCCEGGLSLSIQLAGVGGTGPSVETPSGGGRRVGGDVTGVVVLDLSTAVTL